MLPPKKKRKLDVSDSDDYEVSKTNRTFLASLSRSVTPPLTTREARLPPKEHNKDLPGITVRDAPDVQKNQLGRDHEGWKSVTPEEQPRALQSPIQLTHVRDLSSSYNVDTVRLHDILGDVMIRECWQFNYCFDVDFVMSQFDEDVRNLVQVKIVHGSWKQDSANRIRIDEACARYPNVESIVAYMPEPFGTHHSKMMILLRHDDLAQVIIHTANMLAGDWANMTQAVWRSPLLPLCSIQDDARIELNTIFGSGPRFKRDLLTYLEFYGRKKTGPLVDQLQKYDFQEVRAALIASVPSKEKVSHADSASSTLWGWPALKDALRKVPLSDTAKNEKPHIVTQVSSIASLGQTDKWLKEVFFDSLCPPKTFSNMMASERPKYSVVFPTPDEIRRSLNGYGSGGSIHMKLQSVAQQKQLLYMRPYLCQWAGDRDVPSANSPDLSNHLMTNNLPTAQIREAGRRRAAPHIKTYVRFTDKTRMDRIDWALVTSANISTQAWGAAPNPAGEVRICSWEIGVLVWPDLIASRFHNKGANKPARMVPCFKKDMPDSIESDSSYPIVGLRMPYDLPLKSYDPHDVPWCATMRHPELDWLGQSWEP